MVRGVPTYCPYCGSELLKRRFEGRERRFCEPCDRFVWRDPGPCAGVAVVDGDRILLVERAIEPWKGRWDFPAGFLEVDEHPRDGAARELREETGLDVDPGELSLFESSVYGRGDGEYVLLVLYTVSRRATTGDVVTSEETSDARYFAPDEFDRSDGSMIPPVRGLFDDVSNRVT